MEETFAVIGLGVAAFAIGMTVKSLVAFVSGYREGRREVIAPPRSDHAD